MKPNKRVAVTGGIGSGKSELLSIFKEMGYPVASCDEISHNLWQDEAYRNELAALFPACVISGELNKSVLSALVFSDPISRKKLNAFSHPYIMKKLFASMKGELCFAEVPLLFESGFEGDFDAIIVIKRKREERIAAVRQRSGLTRDEIISRINSQFDYESMADKGYLIVENDGGKADLKRKAERILQTIAP